jgi:uridine phosphorylase
MQFPASELVLDSEGKVYHLGLHPHQIADTIIVVGDQDRVNQVSRFFDKRTHQSQHREFVCHTGEYKGKEITVLSTGIGTDNIDICVNEIDTLFNIDLEKREEKPQKTPVRIVRIGTCGILQPEIPVHSYILSTGAFGLDNIAHFYEIPLTNEEKIISSEFSQGTGLPQTIIPYFIRSSSKLNEILRSDETAEGITVTSSGFYGPQGRELRLKTKTKDLNERLTAMRFGQERIVNFEMESSALFAMTRALGHESATICLGVANRPNMHFSKGYHEEMDGLIRYVLERI